MIGKDRIGRPAGTELTQHPFHRDARAANDRLAIHDIRIDFDAFVSLAFSRCDYDPNHIRHRDACQREELVGRISVSVIRQFSLRAVAGYASLTRPTQLIALQSANYRRRNAPNARGPSPTLTSPITFSSTASMMLSVLLSQFATMMRRPSDVAAIPSG
jgi:hypothetical protein